MSSVFDPRAQDKLAGLNVTFRRSADNNKRKMASIRGGGNDHALNFEDSLSIENILSQDEASDVLAMLGRAKELEGVRSLPGFFTSMQMGSREPQQRPVTLPLSPVPFDGPTDAHTPISPKSPSKPVSDSALHQSFNQDPEHTHLIDNQVYRLLGEESDDDITLAGRPCHTASRADGHDQSSPDLDGLGVNDRDGGRATDPLTQTPPDPQTITNAKTGDDTKLAARGESEEETDNEDSDKESIRDTDDDKYLDTSVAARRIVMIDEIIAQFAKDAAKLADTVKNLESSLELSYKEIADLKKENKDLKLTLGSIDTEDRRTQFQIKEVADKLDKLDSITKKKNLLFEGIPERKKEDTDKVICDLFVQLDINRGIYFEACYRVGPFSEARPRPILVSFE